MSTKLRKKNVLQAVALADDFTTNLTPVQNVYPSILLPVIHVPLLDYLIETLIQSKIEELFLYCSSHVDLLKEYVKEKKCKDLTITLIISDGCRSLGDALRDIDTKGWIRGHFVLIRGDAFIKADLKNALDMHCSTFKNEKGAAMTLLLRNIGSVNSSYLKEETCLIVSNKTDKKVLCYKKVKSNEKKVKLELNWFLEHGEIDINTNFIDTHVYLCSPSVLPLFSDNFDFQTMEDFIRGVLMNEEILDSRIYWQKLNPDDYGLPITSWKAYNILSHDILHRHAFPLAPDVFPALRNLISMPRSTYKHRSATLKKDCVLERDCIVGRCTTLGKNTSIVCSSIGDNCVVGNNVKITNSYIFSNVCVEDNCIIEDSVVFSKCTLHEYVKINGCILSINLNIAPKNEYVDSILESSDNSESIKIRNMFDLDDNEEFLFFKHCELEDYDDYGVSDNSSSDVESRINSPIPDDTNMFLTEVIDSLLRGYQDKLICENLILEINSSRYAYNVTMREVTYNVIKAILSLPLHYLSEIKSPVDTRSYQKNLKTMITYFQPIILNYVKTEDAQDDCLRAMEDVASSTHELLPFLQTLLHIFYDRDVLSEDKILEWYELNDEDNAVAQDLKHKAIRDAVTPFIKWLQEAEEEGSTESDDDR